MPSQDAFYMLPDSIISLILSQIPLIYAVRCSILSKRWRFLYTQMPTLTFSTDEFLWPDCPSDDPLIMPKAENIISSILLLHSRSLEGFDLDSTSLVQWRHFSCESVCKWVRYASFCNVKHLTLCEDSLLGEHPPPALFSCSHLITLDLTGYVLIGFPINFVGFPHLTSCYLYYVQLTDESLASLISLCPLLQNLQITGVSAPNNVVISSSTIEDLSMEGIETLSVKCPKLRRLSVYNIKDLSVNGVRFYELSKVIHVLRMHRANSPIGLYLSDCCSKFISANRCFHIVGNLQYLKELSIDMKTHFEREEERDVPRLNLLYRLPNLQSLSILGFFIQELARDPIPDCLASPHVNLKDICIQVKEFGSEKEIAVISCLLQSTPFLEKMKIQLPKILQPESQLENYERQCMFCKDILYMRRASSLARIIVTIN